MDMPLKINITGKSGNINALPLLDVDVRAASPKTTVEIEDRYCDERTFIIVRQMPVLAALEIIRMTAQIVPRSTTKVWGANSIKRTCSKVSAQLSMLRTELFGP